MRGGRDDTGAGEKEAGRGDENTSSASMGCGTACLLSGEGVIIGGRYAEGAPESRAGVACIAKGDMSRRPDLYCLYSVFGVVASMI